MKLEEGVPTLFLTHQKADPDAIGSIFFLKERFEGDVGLPNEPGKTGRRLLEALEMDYTLDPNIDRYEQIIVVDTPNYEQLGPLEPPLERISVIDHHPSPGWDGDLKDYIYEDRRSCAEIVYDLVDPGSVSPKEGKALIAGMMTDTSFFKRADESTFSTLLEVMKRSGVTIEEAVELVSVERSFSEKICRFKGMRRLDYNRINGYLISSTVVGSFESSVSSLILKAGADIAFSGSQRDHRILVSGRASSEMVELGIDLGGFFDEIAEGYYGTGGGHRGAAVLKGCGDVEETLDDCVDRMHRKISEKGWERDVSRN